MVGTNNADAATAPPLVAVADLRKTYGAVQALRGVNFEVRAGEVHGLCGHNGAGKSTLVKTLVGLEQADEGQILLDGNPVTMHGVQDAQRHGVAILDQELSLVPELTVAENIFLGNVGEPRWIRRAERDQRARELLATVGLAGMAPSRLLASTSLGERQLIEVARLLSRNAKVLVLDEPTATLTDAEIADVFAAIRSVVATGAGVVFVSHRLDEVLDLCDRVSVMRDGEQVASEPVDALTKDDLVRLMLGEVPPSPAPKDEDVDLDAVASGAALDHGLTVNSLAVGSRVHGVNFSVPLGTVVGLAGQLGAGASEILTAIAGLAPDVAGALVVNGHEVRLSSPAASTSAGIHYASNDRKSAGLFIGRSIESNLVATRLKRYTIAGFLRVGPLRKASRRLAQLVGIERRRLPLAVGSLSGGNQQKVFVGRCLDRDDLQVLLLDEPTRGVDVGGRAEIHRLVRHAAHEGAAVVFASTEIDEILDLSDVVVTLYAGRVVAVRRRSETSLAEIFTDITHRQAREAA